METDQCRAILGWKQSNPQWTGNYDYFQSAQPFEGELSPIQEISPLLLPPILTVEETCDVFGSPVLLERLCESDWLVPLPGHEEPYFTAEAVYMAMARLIKGEKPRRSSNEPAPIAGEPEIGSIGSLHGYVNPAKAAEFLDIAPSTLRDYSNRGIIPCVQIASHRRYDLVMIREKLEKERRESGPGRIEALKDLLR